MGDEAVAQRLQEQYNRELGSGASGFGLTLEDESLAVARMLQVVACLWLALCRSKLLLHCHASDTWVCTAVSRHAFDPLLTKHGSSLLRPTSPVLNCQCGCRRKRSAGLANSTGLQTGALPSS